MMSSTDGNKWAQGRGIGPRPVGQLLPTITRAAFRSASAMMGPLIADWVAIVGPGLAQRTMPRRLAGGTLTLACSGPDALELQHQTTELAARVNTYLGRIAVSRIRIVQEVLPRPLPPIPMSRTRVPQAPSAHTDPLEAALADLASALDAEPS